MWPNKGWLSWKCPAAIHMGSGWLSAGSHFLQKRRRGYRYYKNSRAKICFSAVGSDNIKCHHYINNTNVTTTHSPGATKTSCFLERMRRKVRSFWGSMSLTVLLAIIVRLRRSPAYWTAVELSKVVLMGIPEKIKTVTVRLYFRHVASEKTAVLNIHARLLTICVDNYCSNHTFLGFDPLQCVINFSLQDKMKSEKH